MACSSVRLCCRGTTACRSSFAPQMVPSSSASKWNSSCSCRPSAQAAVWRTSSQAHAASPGPICCTRSGQKQQWRSGCTRARHATATCCACMRRWAKPRRHTAAIELWRGGEAGQGEEREGGQGRRIWLPDDPFRHGMYASAPAYAACTTCCPCVPPGWSGWSLRRHGDHAAAQPADQAVQAGLLVVNTSQVHHKVPGLPQAWGRGGRRAGEACVRGPRSCPSTS